MVKPLAVASILVLSQGMAANAMPFPAKPVDAGAIQDDLSDHVVRSQYYYRGHKYKRKTRQHFIRKYHGDDRP